MKNIFLFSLFLLFSLTHCVDTDTPLHRAVKNSDLAAVKQLIEKGSDINARTSLAGDTALHWAVERNSLEIVRFLIEKGADVNVRNKGGETPLSLAKSINYIKPEIAELLKRHNAIE